jgi:hypothetical protein
MGKRLKKRARDGCCHDFGETIFSRCIHPNLQMNTRKNSISKLTLLAVLAANSGLWSGVVMAQDQVQVQP